DVVPPAGQWNRLPADLDPAPRPVVPGDADAHVGRGRVVLSEAGPVALVPAGVNDQPAVHVADGGRPNVRVPAGDGADVRVGGRQPAVALLGGQRALDGHRLADGHP